MARARSNSLFGKSTTYHRDVAGERAQLKREEKQREQKEREWQAELQHDYAYATGARHKKERKKVAASSVTLESAKRALGTKKAASIASAAYGRGYRENPTYSPAQYRLAHAVLSGRAVDLDTMPVYVAREIVAKTPAKLRTEKKNPRNPVDAAAALAEAWHGRPAETETDYVEKVHFHGVLTDLGRLLELNVRIGERHARAIRFDEDTRLASNEKGLQLYVVGGDQSIDLDAFGITGHAAGKDLVTVGEIYSVTYVTAKHHLGREDQTPGPYEHVFREHKQEEPTLVYDTMNSAVGFAGGEYHIDIDIDGKYSAGIRD